MQLSFRLADNVPQSCSPAVLAAAQHECSAAYLKNFSWAAHVSLRGTDAQCILEMQIVALNIDFQKKENHLRAHRWWFWMTYSSPSVNISPGNMEKTAEFKNPKCFLMLPSKILSAPESNRAWNCFSFNFLQSRNFLCISFNSLRIQSKWVKRAQIHVSALLPGNEVFSDRLARSALLSLSRYEPGEWLKWLFNVFNAIYWSGICR